ncbi:tetratricopeptide repeat protein [Synechococcus elongatus IITB4]|uniref:tetratricopeptide repeat protein n=1 Tax=Synechococcus elongatus TaxID=32046 RepID=UPI0030D51834
MSDLDSVSPEQGLAIGQAAIARGDYRQAIAALEAAAEQAGVATAIGADIRYWLATAYQASGDIEAARSVCRQLANHPLREQRQLAAQLLYILEAPKLARRADWQVEIPDLTSLSDDSSARLRQASGSLAKEKKETDYRLTPVDDLSRINTRDNRFLGFGLLFLIALLGWILFRPT